MPKKTPKTKAGKAKKVAKSLKEFKSGDLHSGSKKGPVVTERDQALAISLRQAGLPKGKKGKKS